MRVPRRIVLRNVVALWEGVTNMCAAFVGENVWSLYNRPHAYRSSIRSTVDSAIRSAIGRRRYGVAPGATEQKSENPQRIKKTQNITLTSHECPSLPRPVAPYSTAAALADSVE